MNAMLLRPFRIKTWIKIGFIGWLAGASSSSGANFNYRGTGGAWPGGHDMNDVWRKIHDAIQSIHIGEYIWIIAFIVAIVVIISIIFIYLFSRFRFILFDTVISGNAEIGRGWRRYRDQAHRFFAFWLLYTLAVWAVFGAIIGIPLWHAYKAGVFHRDASLGTIFAVLGSILLGVFLAVVVTAIIGTLARDFLVPMMALEHLSVNEAWAALLRMIGREPLAWAGYLGMKLVLSIAAAIAMAIALVVIILILAIPVVILVLVGVLIAKSAGSVGIAVGIFLLILLVLVFAVFWFLTIIASSAPVVIFFQAYTLYFFGGRYAKLGEILWPSPPPIAPVFGAAPPPAI
jgi:hypothetical protein